MENQEVRNITVNGKHRVKFEKAASANKIDGFVVESNDDNPDKAFTDAKYLYTLALLEVEKNKPAGLVPAAKPEGK